MTVPNQFGTATSAIPLSQLDANFNTPITLGNTAIQLGDTVTTLNNMTLANVTISSGNVTITNVAITTANVSGTANISTLVVVGNATVGGNTTITGNITSSTLTSGRVTYATTSGRLTDSANLLYSGTDLTVYGLTVGRGAGAVATNTAVGASAIAGSGAYGANNTGIGYQTLNVNVGGAQNTAVGAGALKVDTGDLNTAIGYNALTSNTSGSNNTSLGAQALQANFTASNNTAVGYQAGYTNSTGIQNLFLGAQAGYTNNGTSNIAMGFQTLYYNSSGGSNVAIGVQALVNTTASNNTAVGYQAGYTNDTGAYNVFLGGVAGYSSTGSSNLHVGYGAGYLSTGSNNTFVGAFGTGSTACGGAMTSGSKNTIIGAFSGNQGGLNIIASSSYIVLSDGDGNPRGYYDSAASVWNLGGGRTVVGTAFVGDNQASGNNVGFAFGGSGIVPCNGSGAPTDNVLNLGSAAARYATIYAGTGTINTSDANAKQDIEYLSDAERRVAVRIKSLIKKYRFKDAVAEKGDAARIHVGVIAQEVQAAFIAEGLDSARYALFCSDTWYEVDGQGLDENKRAYPADTQNAVEKTRLGIRYDELLAFVIAAL